MSHCMWIVLGWRIDWLLMALRLSARYRRNFLDQHPAQETGAFMMVTRHRRMRDFQFIAAPNFYLRRRCSFSTHSVGDELRVGEHDCAGKAPDYLRGASRLYSC